MTCSFARRAADDKIQYDGLPSPSKRVTNCDVRATTGAFLSINGLRSFLSVLLILSTVSHTIADEKADAKPDTDMQQIDGQSLVPLLRGRTSDLARPLFWHYPHYHGSGSRPAAAVRKGDYKLVRWYENGEEELYKLSDDIGEQKNLASEMTEMRDQLSGELDQWLKDVGARMAVPPQ